MIFDDNDDPRAWELEEEGILDENGELTDEAIEDAEREFWDGDGWGAEEPDPDFEDELWEEDDDL